MVVVFPIAWNIPCLSCFGSLVIKAFLVTSRPPETEAAPDFCFKTNDKLTPCGIGADISKIKIKLVTAPVRIIQRWSVHVIFKRRIAQPKTTKYTVV